MRTRCLIPILVAAALVLIPGSAQAQGNVYVLLVPADPLRGPSPPFCPYDFWNGKPLRTPLSEDLCALLFLHPCLFEGGPPGSCDRFGYRPFLPKHLEAEVPVHSPEAVATTVAVRQENPKVPTTNREGPSAVPERPAVPTTVAPPRIPTVGKTPPPRETPRPPVERPRAAPAREGAPRGMDTPRMAPPSVPTRPR